MYSVCTGLYLHSLLKECVSLINWIMKQITMLKSKWQIYL